MFSLLTDFKAKNYMEKFIITAELRDLEKQVSLGEISYSRMIELLNEKADRWHERKVNKLNKADVSDSVCPKHKITYDYMNNKPICPICSPNRL